MKRILVLLSTLAFSAIAAVEPIFHVSFENTVVPSISRGDGRPELQTPPLYRPGIRGKALLIGRDEGDVFRGVSYPHEKNLDWIQGAISFWVQPVNWKGSDTGFFAPFFTSSAGANNFLIYKYSVGEKLYFMRGKLGFWLFAQYSPGDWRPGVWHHVVCQWDPVQLTMYIDGHLATERRIYFPLKNLERKQKFTIGETNRTIGSERKSGRLSLIDEFRIFDRMLTLSEIKELYRQDLPASSKTDDLVTIPRYPNTFTSSGFSDLTTDEYAVRQNSYSLSYKKDRLLVSLHHNSENAELWLTAPDGTLRKIPFHGKELSVQMPPRGDWQGWLMDIHTGHSHFRDPMAIRRSAEMPGIRIQPPFDLAKNIERLKISQAKGMRLVFDTNTAFSYGFNRTTADLDKPFHSSPKKIPDWQLVDLRLIYQNKECYRARYGVRKNQPTAVKFLYTLLDTRELFVAFQGKAPGKAVMEIISLDSSKKYTEELPMPERVPTFFNLKFPVKAPAGDYVVHIHHLNPQGKKVELWDQELRIPPEKDPKIRPYTDPEKDLIPPGGWTPVQAEQERFSMWGRRYQMNDGLLFASLLSQKKELLSEPDALVLNGKRLVPRHIQVSRQSADKLKAVYQKTVTYDQCRIESRLTIHFDGYARIKMTVIPQGKLQVQELAYEIPMKNECLKIVRDNRTFGQVTGLVGKSFTAPLLGIPSIWAGDYYSGINFTAENLVNWHLRRDNMQVEMKRDSRAARMRFLLVGAPLVISSAREYHFGITVTPVKPLNRKLLRLRVKDYQIFSPWHHMTYLDPKRIKMAPPWNGMEFYRGQHQLFPILLLYSAYNFAGPFWPEWTWYEQNWRQIKYGRTYGIWTGTKPHGYCEGCINCRDYRNFRLNMLRDFISLKDNPLFQPGSRNFYFDAPWEESCYNSRHGCRLWKDSRGREHTHILIDVFREKAINVWRMIKRADKESLVTYHSEWQRIMPYQAFQDFMFGGEGMESQVSSHGSYYDILTPASFNATFSPYLWSAKMIMIPQIERGLQLHAPTKYRDYNLKKTKWRKSYLHILGLAALHDVELYSRNELTKLLWEAQDRLGWNEKTVFHPYYESSPALTTFPHSERIVSSAYTNEGRLLLVILNDTDQEQKITVNLDLKKLGVKEGLTGKDVFEPELSWQLGSRWQDLMVPRGLRMILFQK